MPAPGGACRWATAGLTAVVLGASVGACGADDPVPRAAPQRPPTLSARAIPYLDSSEHALTPAGLARETRLDSLPGQLARWGYAGGTGRTFQGQSRRLQLVESRTLRFRTAGGARAFLALVRTRPAAFLPGAETPRAFSSRGRRGIAVKAAACSCHLATPAYLGVVARGPKVSSLEINRPRAGVRALTRLAAQAP